MTHPRLLPRSSGAGLVLTTVLVGAVTALTGCGGSGGSATSSSSAGASSAASSAASTGPSHASGTASGTTSATASGTASGKTYSTAVVADHDNETSCWVIIDGSVYDLTAWIGQHPGGPDRIRALCGTDATDQFQAQHGGDSEPQERLATFRIGTLKD